MRTDAIIILSAFAISGIGAIGGAFLGQRLWRQGRRLALLAWAGGLAALAGGLFWTGSQMRGLLAGLDYAFGAVMIWCGPVLGLLLGAVIGWAMDWWAKGRAA